MNVCVITGTRAEFGIWRPVLEALQTSQALRVQLLVTGMHLLPGFGRTVRDIEAEGFAIDARVPMYRGKEPAAKSLARGIEGMGKAFASMKTDLVLVLGDRLEMLAAASAALAGRLRLAHLHGGEIAPGQWDEQIRHAISKMAHLHFCATAKAAERIVRMGEDPENVHVVGAPALDVALQFARELDEVFQRGGGAETASRRAEGILPMLVLHPTTGSDEEEHRRTLMVIDALLKVFPPVRISAIGPNNDPGHQGILQAYRERFADMFLQMSAPQETFWAEIAAGGLLVGNSSSGIIEAATFGVPVVNIGSRQAGRERSGNVLDVGWNAREIEQAVRRAISDGPFRARVARRINIYGDGHASERIGGILEKLARDPGPAPAAPKQFWEPSVRARMKAPRRAPGAG
jgi:UDP-hydrolysing UDP-N-acetyl-D-glucosamine 2-epimerase